MDPLQGTDVFFTRYGHSFWFCDASSLTWRYSLASCAAVGRHNAGIVTLRTKQMEVQEPPSFTCAVVPGLLHEVVLCNYAVDKAEPSRDTPPPP